jgi:esterase
MVAKTFTADSGVEIHSSSSGNGPPVILLHGLFGAGGNLGALARNLGDSFRVYALDLPGHGKSQWLDAYSLSAMAGCVYQWMQREELGPANLVGHSLGGKVAMQLALSAPESVMSLTIADIAPVEYPGSHDAVFNALEAVSSSACRSRAQAATVMGNYLQEQDVIQFLLGSLQRLEEGEYVWRMDVAGLRRDYPLLLQAPEANSAFDGPAIFIKGSGSDYIQEKHRSAIEKYFPSASLKVMQDCGHWLHVEKPDLFNSIVRRYLRAVDRN